MTNVVEIKKEVRRSVIETLEFLLEKAQHGEISELIVLYANEGVFNWECTPSDDVQKTIGQLETLKSIQISRMFE